jgi:hypothetical protein
VRAIATREMIHHVPSCSGVIASATNPWLHTVYSCMPSTTTIPLY